MGNGIEVLEKVESLAAGIGESMSAVCDYLENEDQREQLLGSCRFEAGVIIGKENDFKQALNAASEWVLFQWNEIIQNDVLTKRFLWFFDQLMTFDDEIRKFDNAVSGHEDVAADFFDDIWIARRYFTLLYDWKEANMDICIFAKKRLRIPSQLDDPFVGCARRLRKYFVGVSDSEIRKFVLDGVSLVKRPKWLADRTQGTVFGQTLGISCKDMNDSFLFVNSDGLPRKLNYSQDKPTLDFNNYGIYRDIQELMEYSKKRNLLQ